MNYTTQQLGINHDDLFSVITFVCFVFSLKTMKIIHLKIHFFFYFLLFQGGGRNIKLEFYTKYNKIPIRYHTKTKNTKKI